MNIAYPLNSFSRDDIAAVNHACIGDCILHKRTGEYGSFQLVGTSLAPGACMLAGRYWETDSYTPIDLAVVEGEAYIKIRLDTTQQNYGFSVVCEAAAAASGNGVYEMNLYTVTVAGGIITVTEKQYSEIQSMSQYGSSWTHVTDNNSVFGGGSVTNECYYAVLGNIVFLQAECTIKSVPETEPRGYFFVDPGVPECAAPKVGGSTLGFVSPATGEGYLACVFYGTGTGNFIQVSPLAKMNWAVGDVVYLNLFYFI